MDLLTIKQAGQILRPDAEAAIQRATVYNFLTHNKIKEVKVDRAIVQVGGKNVMVRLDRPLRLLDAETVRAAKGKRKKGRPVEIEGEEYESIAEAAEKTGRSYYHVRKNALK